MTAPGGGSSPMRVGGLALIGVAVVAAIIGLASMATNGDPSPTAAPRPDTPSTVPAPEIVPPPAQPPEEPLPPGDGTPPAPPLAEPGPGEAPPEQAPPQPGAPAPAPEPAPAPAPAPAPNGTPADPGAPGPAQAPPPPGPAGGGSPPAAPGGNGGVGGHSGEVSRDVGAGKGGTSAVHAPLRVYNNSTIKGLAARAAEDFRRAGWPIDEVGNYPHGIIPTTTVYFRPGTDEEAPARALGEQFGMRVNPRFEGLKEATPGIIVIVTNDYGR